MVCNDFQKEKLMEKTKFSKHSKPKSKTRFLQKITFSLASEACTALKLHWLAHCAKKGCYFNWLYFLKGLLVKIVFQFVQFD